MVASLLFDLADEACVASVGCRHRIYEMCFLKMVAFFWMRLTYEISVAAVGRQRRKMLLPVFAERGGIFFGQGESFFVPELEADFRVLVFCEDGGGKCGEV